MARILVVEDDADNQDLVTRFLRREGHRVINALDGFAGVKEAKEQIPDLIVMDLGLPGMDGWEASRRIRQDPETSHIPIIALTAHAFTDEVTKAVEAGIDSYELKPVVYQRLMQKIAEALRKSRPVGQAR
jgi:two-component system, cell cycle response regulator DivK